MNRKIVLVILILSVYLGCAQKQLTQTELETMFSKDWCACLEKESVGKDGEQIPQIWVDCVAKIMKQYTENEILYADIRKFAMLNYPDSSLSDYERERLFGKQLGKKMLVQSLDNCDIYLKGMSDFKTSYIRKATQDASSEDKKEVEMLIKKIQEVLDEVDINKMNDAQKNQIGEYYVLLGLLYEFKGDKSLAILQYDKAIKLVPYNYKAIAFKKLIN
ncbi:hypothetical protein [Capnocytophaga felis]|uniref:Uncharacterized protein n=1 Tax=Capnocytophaga felis TaxID=2267611 RepID=A0A5M4BAW9_9FLAO|nr:hypothetical protein [Capnocytophaga felis]GET46699.1 hypothetical protein RCZ01_20010 [Capnocytophaga felis]GET48800.1 hypothetical protein RCZ02_16310 [Capnocytophaga felis]